MIRRDQGVGRDRKGSKGSNAPGMVDARVHAHAARRVAKHCSPGAEVAHGGRLRGERKQQVIKQRKR